MLHKKKKIGEILIANSFITKRVLSEALVYQHKFGIGITEFLIMMGYINEVDLVKALTQQFSLPYLPLEGYVIPQEIIKAVPVEIAKKYLLIPINRVGDVLSVVMADPFDAKAVKQVEKATGCKVEPFIGIFSDIQQALRKHYKIEIKRKPAGKRKMPSYIAIGGYQGLERRRAIRYGAAMDLYFSTATCYKKAELGNFSLNGILFTCSAEPSIPHTVLQIEYPERWDPKPLLILATVVRSVRLSARCISVAVEFKEVINDDVRAVFKYVKGLAGCAGAAKIHS